MLRPQVLRHFGNHKNLSVNTFFRQFSFSPVTGNRELSTAVPKIVETSIVDEHDRNAGLPFHANVRRARNGRSAMKEVGIQPILYTVTMSPSPMTETVSDKGHPSELCYFGNKSIPIDSKIHIISPNDDTPRGIWPAFRMMVGLPGRTIVHSVLLTLTLAFATINKDEDGRFRESTGSPLPTIENESLTTLRNVLVQRYPSYINEFSQNPLLQPSEHDYPDIATKNTLLRAHQQIIRLREMDVILQNVQRQGRISFYMTCRGEEAIHMGAAAALDLGDTVLAQYREAGILMWRGFTLEQFTNQCFSNDLDLGKGRQMPVHYGSRALNYHTVSSPLGTQLPQAVGAGYRLKLQKKDNVAICFFGDGCASTTDFHSACNFAATLHVPVIFFCRNNGFAISTPVEEQYAGDGIVSRAPGYGMAGIRVDGNDIFAVSSVVKAAKDYALENSAPVLIEAMTYRLGHHSTSDDSSRYRNVKDVEHLADFGDPVKRLEAFLTEIGWLDNDSLAAARAQERKAILEAIDKAQKRPLPDLKALFEDVYHEMPAHLKRQEEDLRRHIAKYPGKYNRGGS